LEGKYRGFGFSPPLPLPMVEICPGLIAAVSDVS
jgi:hypothetical protein